MTFPIGSIVIPAHDDGPRVVRCLHHLLADAAPGEWEVVVVANGCTDDTASQVAAIAHPDVTCIEIGAASKVAALNRGDDVVSTFPRIYLDADVLVGTESARSLVEVLRTGPALAAAPRLHYDVSQVGPLARRYLRVLESLPVFADNYVGSGCYALSAAGRARFGPFPDIVGDDRYVNELFDPAEKSTLRDRPMRVAPPRNLRSVVRRSLRVKAGSLELEHLSVNHTFSSTPSTVRHLLNLARRPSGVVDVVVFATVQVVVAALSYVRRRLQIDRTWLRDESSRR